MSDKQDNDIVETETSPSKEQAKPLLADKVMSSLTSPIASDKMLLESESALKSGADGNAQAASIPAESIEKEFDEDVSDLRFTAIVSAYLYGPNQVSW